MNTIGLNQIQTSAVEIASQGFDSPLFLFVIITKLAKVPALSCRLGRVPYDHAFGALIVRSLSITKKFD